mmetsp:Transcript_58007/g.179901  ORF Transcript_58007/g.179901 Transcript_58007/m.179901 type:complete len:232 (-) Transcript_58007:104-799(-)
MEPITGFSSPALAWSNTPAAWKLDEEAGSLEITPDTGRDYWARTYYTPPLIKSDAPALLAAVPSEQEVTLEVSFTLRPVEQFDQAGVLVRVDEGTWAKAGIEYCDGAPRLSCVVTNGGFSDWSTQELQGLSLRMRVHKLHPGPEQGHCIVVEVAPATGGKDGGSEPPAKTGKPAPWTFVRIASLRSEGKPWHMGPFAASPIQQIGGGATFHSLHIGPKTGTSHQTESGHIV